MFRLLTDITIVAHLAFIAFVVLGAFVARHRRWLMIVHLSALTWAVYAELSPGVVCPLTVLENYFARRAGLASYQDDFVAHYVVPVIYQEGLSPRLQYLIVALVLVASLTAYATKRRSV